MYSLSPASVATCLVRPLLCGPHIWRILMYRMMPSMLMITITLMTTLKAHERRYVPFHHAPPLTMLPGRAPPRHPPFSQPRLVQPSITVSGAAICSSGLPSASMPNTISTSPPMIMMPPPTTYPMASPVRLAPLPISTP